jgi:hypothetical protein
MVPSKAFINYKPNRDIKMRIALVLFLLFPLNGQCFTIVPPMLLPRLSTPSSLQQQQHKMQMFGPEDEDDCPEDGECEIDWDNMPGFEDDDEEEEEILPTASAEEDEADLSKARRRLEMQMFGPEYEDDCPEDGECEIDWDKMPGFEDDEEEEEAEEKEADSSSARRRMEMHWGMTEAAEDCDIEAPVTCGSDPCQDCRGRGVKSCRFCNGKMVLTWSTNLAKCSICQHGTEVCPTCRGSGWVADWTNFSSIPTRAL